MLAAIGRFFFLVYISSAVIAGAGFWAVASKAEHTFKRLHPELNVIKYNVLADWIVSAFYIIFIVGMPIVNTFLGFSYFFNFEEHYTNVVKRVERTHGLEAWDGDISVIVDGHERRIPQVEGVYRHFKGKYYHVLGVVTHSETGERLVLYTALYGNGRTYVRPYDMFFSKVDRLKYPDVKQEYRFERVDSYD